MNEGEFAWFQADSGKLYVEELLSTGNFTPDQAQERAAADGTRLLPQGLNTSGAILLTITLNEETIGYLWFQRNNDTAFTFGFKIAEHAKGHGYCAMIRARKILREMGVKRVSLNVFGRHERTVKLYQKMGFNVVSYNMSTEL